ncbi:hypothetical protein SAMN05216404_11534 [Nitrosospira multiformis]|uniref:Uncharacterized protein n=1 Tax=Nitrosospira multiformis TaxID=1231 RepID=A0A1H8N5L9_9PROT|nr:hypothetical protein [Nitrosospira multiformis]SEO24925.1 hypothetical protein SAMN05216404_11534 [Nitrosospira multiformis]
MSVKPSSQKESQEALDKAANSLGHLLKALGHGALNNSIALLALVVASISLYLSLIDRQESRHKEMLALTMLLEPVEHARVFIAAPKDITTPYQPPYLMFPVRIFVMNGSTLPQTITDLWISFDEGPDEKIRFVKLDGVRETDGKLLSWPKTISPRETVAFDVSVPIPVSTKTLAKIGYRANDAKSSILGSAGRLNIAINERAGPNSEVFDSLRQQVTFSLRLMSPSPGSPSHVTLRRRLPW